MGKLKQTLLSVSSAARIKRRGTDFVAMNKERDAIIALVRVFREREVQNRLVDLAHVFNPAYAGWACRVVTSQILNLPSTEDDKWFWQQSGEEISVGDGGFRRESRRFRRCTRSSQQQEI